ncbi:hypothetical protein C8A03DRAFT_16585 [Achaetomium macrosporum]|uniref:Uncharacterized protein n=1 Tax=Achaetomium macrosporum TaxID=79813 RepID=A0AAN7HCZ8_9PEZI|nr:hypothetical protein C8A03DRAFT_16585 [Achaetomium macrosporum]
MKNHRDQVQDTPVLGDVKRDPAVHKLIGLLHNLTADKGASTPDGSTRDVLSAIEELLLELTPGAPLYAAFHDGQVHDPLGAGAYAFRDDFIGAILLGLANDEISGASSRDEDAASVIPTRPIIFHAGAQPNNSPHCGTLVVFCYTFAVARAVKDRLEARAAGMAPPVSVEITLVDTAPVSGEGIEVDGIQYQSSYRDVPNALDTCIADYREVLAQLSIWSGIPVRTTFQRDFFSQAHMPSLVSYLVANHKSLGRQLSPTYGTLALRAACPVAGCHLAEKHGRLNQYTYQTTLPRKPAEPEPSKPAAAITFQCPRHGPHTITTSSPDAVARLEANAPTRNLLRSMAHLLDTDTHHVRITGADYAGMYQETFLYRPLAAWSAATGLARGRTPHILYAPLVVDWSGAKLSKSLYVREGGYAAMRLFGSDGLCSYARLKEQVGEEGLRRLWDEVVRWVADPRKLFRCWSVEYLHRAVIKGEVVG